MKGIYIGIMTVQSGYVLFVTNYTYKTKSLRCSHNVGYILHMQISDSIRKFQKKTTYTYNFEV